MVAASLDPHQDQPSFDRSVWRSLVDEFRALGGEIENIVPRHLSTRVALFAENPALSILLKIPENLLLKPWEIAFSGDRICVDTAVEHNQRERDFLDYYLYALSWCTSGHEASSRFIDTFDELDPSLRATLASDFGMDFFSAADRQARIVRFFVSGRTIGRGRENIVAPFLDLMKRSENGLRVTNSVNGGLEIHGVAEGQIFLGFGHHDPLGIFKKYGLARPRHHAFSLATRIDAGSITLAIARDPLTSTEKSGIRMPLLHSESHTIHLSYLMVGNANFPRTPRAVFHKLMREAQIGPTDGIFDKILYANRRKILSLLEALESYGGELVTLLRKMALFQLAALAECVGTRAL